jgi:peptidoglycan/LPS O-acetylase OafA/YrhL
LTSSPRNPELTHPKYRADVDGLRAIAVLSVVAYHAAPQRVGGGFIGVDIFFVISGFLISTIIFENLQCDSFSFIEFYSRRIRRIFPAFIIVLATCFAAGWFLLLPAEYKQLGKHIAGGAGFISNIILWRESGYFDNAADTKPLLHLWSLGIEEQFYIVWPLLLWAAWKRNISWLTISVAIIAVSFVLNITIAKTDTVADFYSPQTRFWELLVGSILAYSTLNGSLMAARQKLYKSLGAIVYRKVPEPDDNTVRNIESWFGITLIIVGIIVITSQRPYPFTWALLPTLGAGLIISAGSQAWYNSKVLANRVLVWFGLISFPLYLWHLPLLSFARIVQGGTPHWSVRVAAVFVSIALAWLTYRLIERPIRFGGRVQAKTIALLVLMAVVGYGGYKAYQRDGLAFRFKSESHMVAQLLKIPNTYEYFNGPKVFRTGVCHSVALNTAYANNCLEVRQKNILIWGDSFAACLYNGLNHVRNESFENYGIEQLTDNNGAPFFTNLQTDEHIPLTELNNDRLAVVEKLRPNIILITWIMIDGRNGPKEETFDELSKTVAKIKKSSPTSKIIILGPVPSWGGGSLIKQLIRFEMLHGYEAPKYMSFGLNPQNKIWDDYFKINVPKLNVTYISAMDNFCNEKGCLTRIDDNPNDVTSFDLGHLTPAGSIYLIEKIKNSIFSAEDLGEATSSISSADRTPLGLNR